MKRLLQLYKTKSKLQADRKKTEKDKQTEKQTARQTNIIKASYGNAMSYRQKLVFAENSEIILFAI